jgi:hypothetical protein
LSSGTSGPPTTILRIWSRTACCDGGTARGGSTAHACGASGACASGHLGARDEHHRRHTHIDAHLGACGGAAGLGALFARCHVLRRAAVAAAADRSLAARRHGHLLNVRHFARCGARDSRCRRCDCSQRRGWRGRGRGHGRRAGGAAASCGRGRGRGRQRCCCCSARKRGRRLLLRPLAWACVAVVALAACGCRLLLLLCRSR